MQRRALLSKKDHTLGSGVGMANFVVHVGTLMRQIGDEELAYLDLFENSIRYRTFVFDFVGCNGTNPELLEYLPDAALDVFKFRGCWGLLPS